MKILIIGGAGYIGSHTLLQLLRTQFEVYVYDNFSNSSIETLRRVKFLANHNFSIQNGDINDQLLLEKTFKAFKPNVVIHYAGLKSVSESLIDPLNYYEQNISGTINLLKTMKKYNCKNIIFSSSAAVYGDAIYLPYDEGHEINPKSPYGRTKYFIEELIKDWVRSFNNSSAIILRYFNPIGADSSSLIGDKFDGNQNNLLSNILQVAIKHSDFVSIFGDDFKTRDGTGERDYIHIEDLANAHIKALNYLLKYKGVETFNIGTGNGLTVLELIKNFEEATNLKIPYKIFDRREGDIAISYASVKKANLSLNWKAEHTIKEACKSSWKWFKNNLLE